MGCPQVGQGETVSQRDCESVGLRVPYMEERGSEAKRDSEVERDSEALTILNFDSLHTY